MKSARVWTYFPNGFEGSLLSREGNKQIVNLTIEWKRYDATK